MERKPVTYGERDRDKVGGTQRTWWIPRFPRIPLIYISSRHRKGRKARRRPGEEEERALSRGGRTISAVCMRGRRQTLLNCPMTPYILSSERTLSFLLAPFYPLLRLSSRYTDLEETNQPTNLILQPPLSSSFVRGFRNEGKRCTGYQKLPIVNGDNKSIYVHVFNRGSRMERNLGSLCLRPRNVSFPLWNNY